MSPNAAKALLVVGGLTIISPIFRTSSEDPDSAYKACRRFVESRLRAPAAASFGKISQREEVGFATVSLYVDAENGFGAKIRGYYTCRLRDTGSTWTLDDLRED